MGCYTFSLALIFICTVSAVGLLTASIISVGWFEQETVEFTNKLGLWRSCLETVVGSTCKTRDGVLAFNPKYKDFDTALLLNIIAIIMCLVTLIFGMVYICHMKPKKWLVICTAVLCIFAAIFTTALVVFTETYIYKTMSDYNRAWGFYTSFAAMFVLIVAAICASSIPCCYVGDVTKGGAKEEEDEEEEVEEPKICLRSYASYNHEIRDPYAEYPKDRRPYHDNEAFSYDNRPPKTFSSGRTSALDDYEELNGRYNNKIFTKLPRLSRQHSYENEPFRQAYTTQYRVPSNQSTRRSDDRYYQVPSSQSIRRPIESQYRYPSASKRRAKSLYDRGYTGKSKSEISNRNTTSLPDYDDNKVLVYDDSGKPVKHIAVLNKNDVPT